MLETKAGSGTECAGAGVREGKSSGPCRIVVMVSGGGTNLQAIIDACPYNIPRYDAATKRLTKCDMCIDRVSNGMVPMCVKTCPTGAMTFGERAEVLEKARKRLESVKAEFPKARLIDAEDVNVIYLLAEEPEHYHDFAAFAQR